MPGSAEILLHRLEKILRRDNQHFRQGPPPASRPAPPTENPAQRMRRYNDFFAKNDEVWAILNPLIGSTAKEALVIHIGDRQSPYRIPPITPGLPVLLTLAAPKAMIRESDAVRKAHQRGAIELLTEAEAANAFEEFARLTGQSVESLVRSQVDDFELRKNHEEPAPAASSSKKLPSYDDAARVIPKTAIPEWVQSLVASCSAVDPSQRPLETQAVNQLAKASAQFNEETLQFLLSCTFGGVRDLATRLLEARIAAQDEKAAARHEERKSSAHATKTLSDAVATATSKKTSAKKAPKRAKAKTKTKAKTKAKGKTPAPVGVPQSEAPPT